MPLRRELAFGRLLSLPMKSPRSPRKKPVQDRSQITVEALVDAAARIFRERGYEAATTNHVAELAGVSVGSLYQYFPNKLALLSAVRGNVHRKFIEHMIAACSRGCGLPFEKAVRGMAETSASFHEENAELYRLFVAELPSTSPVDVNSLAGLRYHDAQAQFFQIHAAHIRIPREQALFFTRNAGSAIMQAAVMNHAEKLRDGSIATQLTRAFVAYLSGSAAGVAPVLPT
jgi:AcrR family transcriptional regulator